MSTDPKSTDSKLKGSLLSADPKSNGTPRLVIDRADLSLMLSASDTVDHPSHYHAASGIEVIDAIEAWELNFALGNAIKYIARAGRKDPKKATEDLSKALWYIERELDRLGEEGGSDEG